ncbi:hypothetical protein HM1_0210 [Heliomicrobium modesticaldum Ice1]|uniref:Uncharacterized protein n=1 Tax=Heliobacterium modesticaldum (strain ATCC 51547 / Ice1) TaxID=498761 RepID=B0TDW6_HELMI|nr:hypothetical protein HM1_0210 [Heliomicrobium modesticaldum Ice1]
MLLQGLAREFAYFLDGLYYFSRRHSNGAGANSGMGRKPAEDA